MVRAPRTLAALAATAALVCTGCATDTDGIAQSVQTTSAALSPSEWASIEVEAGIPPEPDAATVAAYIAELEAIDPDIVHGEPDKAIDRGRNICQSIANGVEGEQLIASTNMRFISPNHPGGFGQEVAAQIVEHTRSYLCP